MKNNVYIGNRYVPVFANPVEWDNLRQYEPLTIVTYQGTAYTSRKTVPVGTALSNTDYWVVTGNYNAQVEQYRQEALATENRVDVLEPKVNTMETKVNILTEDIVVCVGDSYLEGYTHSGAVNSWGYYLQNYLGMDNNHFKRIYQGGIGLSTSTSYADLLTSHLSDFTADQKSKVKYILLAGCYNDAGASDSDILTGMIAFREVVKNNFPNAKLYAIPVGWQCKALIPSQWDTGKTNQQCVWAIERWFQACNNAGVRMCDLVYTVLFDNRCFSNDYYHPNAIGQQLIGAGIFQCVFGHGFNFDTTFAYQGLQNFTADSGSMTFPAASMSHQVKGSQTELRFNGIGNFIYTPTSAFNVNAVHGFMRKLGTYADAGFQFSGTGVSVPCAAYVRTSSNNYYKLNNAVLYFVDDTVYLHFGEEMNDSHNNYLSITGINQITIMNGGTRFWFDNLLI